MDAGALVAVGTPRALIAQYAPLLVPAEAERRQPNLEEGVLALTGRALGSDDTDPANEEAAWRESLAEFPWQEFRGGAPSQIIGTHPNHTKPP